MRKWVLAALLVTVEISSFSEESSNDSYCSLQKWQEEALLHCGYGNAHLLLNEPRQALEQFQRASSLLDKSDGSFCPIRFLVTFNQIVAYDCLGLHDQCKQAVGSLFLGVHEWDDGDDSVPEENEGSQTEDKASEFIIHFLRSLASFAPSPDVRGLLFSITDDVAEELLPAFQLAD